MTFSLPRIRQTSKSVKNEATQLMEEVKEEKKKITGFQKLKKWKWKFGDQKPIKELSWKDVVHWKNLYFTGGLLLVFNIIMYLLHTGYSFHTLLFSLIATNILIFICFYGLKKVMKRESTELFDFTIKWETVEQPLKKMVEKLNKKTAKFQDILSCKDFKKSIKAFLFFAFMALVSRLFCDICMISTVFNFKLIVPCMLDVFDEEWSVAKKKMKKIFDAQTKKYRPIVEAKFKEILAKVQPKINEFLAKINKKRGKGKKEE